MNRKAQIEICKNCTHCKRDINRGIVCGLTNEYATFEAECPKFDASDSYIAKLRARNTRKEGESDLTRELPAVIATYLFCLISSLVGDDNSNVTWGLLAVGVVIIGISLCIFFHARGCNIWRDRSKLNRNKIKEILRVDGYCPQIGENGAITFKIEGETYKIAYYEQMSVPVFQLMYGFCYEEEIDTARAAALKVMDDIVMAKITVQQYPEQEQGLWIFISVEVATDSAEEIEKRFSDYVAIVRIAKDWFIQLLDEYLEQHQGRPMPVPRRNEFYFPEYYWIPQMAEAVCTGKLAVDALSDEAWLRQQIISRVPAETAQEWGVFHIERINKYGDYMLFVYGFPEPRSIPEAKYSAILLNTQTKVFDYYTLEFSYNDKWVLGRMQGTQHTNYGELEAQPDVDTFVDWIFSSDKIVQAITYCEKGDTKNIN